jgi:hypothetical protein
MEVITLLLVLLALALIARRWGADSTESRDSLEWKRRQERGFFL